jgi:hypothetical protein
MLTEDFPPRCQDYFYELDDDDDDDEFVEVTG